jgi:NADPH:quinone reductase-like Zn-dependent oxidoreductase
MRAAVQEEYGDPERLFTVQSSPVPVPDKGEVLVEVHAAGVNWADRSMTVGEPYIMRLGYGFTAPRRGIRGLEMAGRVIALGPGVASEDGRIDIGQDVFGACPGAFAEFAVAKAAQIAPMPAGAGYVEMAGVPIAGCVALQAIRDVGAIDPGDRILIVGASGGIGMFAIQIAKAAGAHVTGVCSTPNVDFVRSLGADEVIDYTIEDFTARKDRFDLILDMADRHSLRARRDLLAPSGTLIPNSGEGGRWIGSVGRIIKARLASPFVRGRQRPFFSMTKRDDLLALSKLIEDGTVTPVVGATLPLDRAGDAIALAGSGHARGKTVLTISDGGR